MGNNDQHQRFCRLFDEGCGTPSVFGSNVMKPVQSTVKMAGVTSKIEPVLIVNPDGLIHNCKQTNKQCLYLDL